MRVSAIGTKLMMRLEGYADPHPVWFRAKAPFTAEIVAWLKERGVTVKEGRNQGTASLTKEQVYLFSDQEWLFFIDFNSILRGLGDPS